MRNKEAISHTILYFIKSLATQLGFESGAFTTSKAPQIGTANYSLAIIWDESLMLNKLIYFYIMLAGGVGGRMYTTKGAARTAYLCYVNVHVMTVSLIWELTYHIKYNKCDNHYLVTLQNGSPANLKIKGIMYNARHNYHPEIGKSGQFERKSNLSCSGGAGSWLTLC